MPNNGLKVKWILSIMLFALPTPLLSVKEESSAALHWVHCAGHCSFFPGQGQRGHVIPHGLWTRVCRCTYSPQSPMVSEHFPCTPVGIFSLSFLVLLSLLKRSSLAFFAIFLSASQTRSTTWQSAPIQRIEWETDSRTRSKTSSNFYKTVLKCLLLVYIKKTKLALHSSNGPSSPYHQIPAHTSGKSLLPHQARILNPREPPSQIRGHTQSQNSSPKLGRQPPAEPEAIQVIRSSAPKLG